MICNKIEYKGALKQIQYLEDWLNRLSLHSQENATGLTKAGIRKMIARIQMELGAFEAQQEMKNAKKRRSA